MEVREAQVDPKRIETYIRIRGRTSRPGAEAKTSCFERDPETASHVVSKLTVMTITMYGADWCRDCVRAEKFFVDNNIEFQKIDLELDENEHFVEAEVLRRNNGKKSIPVIVFDDDSHLTEPTNAQLAEKLGLLS